MTESQKMLLIIFCTLVAPVAIAGYAGYLMGAL